MTDAEGLTAIAWGKRMGRSSVIEALEPEGAAKSPHTHRLIPSHGPAVRLAAERDLVLLEKNGSAWLEQQRCASCHHQGLLLPLARVARRQGFAVDETRAHAQEVRLRTFLSSYEPAMHVAHESDEATVTTDKVYRLLGLHWSDADRHTVHDAAQALLEEQDETGGWAQLPGLNPDAYATGLALVALREAEAFTPSQSGYRRGVRFLVRTQQPDGSWFVHKRAASFNPYFESGFPYDKHQFSSFTGTAWATMALIYASQPEEK